jgi:hypothetical protein
MARANALPIPLRPVNPMALIEAAEASGLDDEQIGRLIQIMLPESLLPSWGPLERPAELTIRRAMNTPTLRLLAAIREVGDDV